MEIRLPPLPALCFCSMLVFLAGSVRAEEYNWWTVGAYLDNDLFADEDDGYTNGVRLSFVSPDIDNFRKDKRLPQWLRSFNQRVRLLSGNEALEQKNMVITLGQQMFTPDEEFIDRTDLVVEDRPYAGWLYLGLGYQLREKRKLETAVLNIGVVGPASYAKESQDFIHDLRGFEKFQGWDNQLKNELGLQFIYVRKSKSRIYGNHNGLNTDLNWSAGASLGNVATYFDIGTELRLGWRLPDDFGTSSANVGGDNSTPGSNIDSRIRNQRFGGFHGFIAANAKWVLRDITLDGNTFRNSHSVDKRPIVGVVQVGVAAQIRRWKISLSRFVQSREFEGQPTSRGYGSISLSYVYRM